LVFARRFKIFDRGVDFLQMTIHKQSNQSAFGPLDFVNCHMQLSIHFVFQLASASTALRDVAYTSLTVSRNEAIHTLVVV
jgi:hypothetical protein